MKNLLIISALPLEINPIKDILKNVKINNFKISFLTTWVWNLNVVYSLKEYFDKKQKPDFILNIWTCWAKTWKDMSYFQVCRIKNLSNNKESIPPVYLKLTRLDEILCSDKVILKWDDLKSFEYVDMESYWIDFVCSKEKIPFLLLKKPFDIVWNNSKNLDLKNLQISIRSIEFEEIIKLIWEYLEKNSPIFSNLEMEKFKKKYLLTFSEFEIFKKFLNKNIAFWVDKNQIFKDIRSLEKKEFLNKIKQL